MNVYLVGADGHNYLLEENSLELIPVNVTGAFYLDEDGRKDLVLTKEELERLNWFISQEGNLFWELSLYYSNNYFEENEISTFFRIIHTKAKYYREENNEIFKFFVDSFLKEFAVNPENFSEFINWGAFMNYYLYNNPKYFLSDDECRLIEIIEEGSPDYETVHY